MEFTNKKIVLAAIILSLITSLFIYSYINSLTKASNADETVNIYVAAKTIPARAMISAADIKEIQISKKLALPGAFQNKAEIIGKRVKESILSGEQILKERLAEQNKLNLAYTIPKNKRAVSINVNEASEVANFIRPGDYVDIIATFEKEEITDKNRKLVYPKISKVILQNILILGLGQESQIPEEQKNKELPKTITLAVDTIEAEKLVYASEAGVLRLALRPVGDTENIKTDGSTRPEITGNKGLIIFQNN